MIFAVGLPPDHHIVIENTWLNWPKKENNCYTAHEIELIIESYEYINGASPNDSDIVRK